MNLIVAEICCHCCRAVVHGRSSIINSVLTICILVEIHVIHGVSLGPIPSFQNCHIGNNEYAIFLSFNTCRVCVVVCAITGIAGVFSANACSSLAPVPLAGYQRSISLVEVNKVVVFLYTVSFTIIESVRRESDMETDIGSFLVVGNIDYLFNILPRHQLRVLNECFIQRYINITDCECVDCLVCRCKICNCHTYGCNCQHRGCNCKSNNLFLHKCFLS